MKSILIKRIVFYPANTMELLIATFESVAVLIGIGVVGFAVVARRLIPESVITVITPLGILIAIPCLVGSKMLTQFDPAKFPLWWSMPLWWAGFMVLMGALTVPAMRLARKEFRSEFGLSLYYPNAIFVPIALISGMFGYGSPYLVDLFLFTLFYPAFFFSSYHLFFNHSGDKSKRRNLTGKLLNPILLATLTALGIRLIGADKYIPEFVISMLTMIGGMAIPLIMIIIGGSIYIDYKKKGHFYLLECIKFIGLKNIIYPLIMLLLLIILRPSYNIALLLMIESAVPPITAVPIVIEYEGGNRSIANQFLFTSFCASIITLPGMMLLFSRFFTP